MVELLALSIHIDGRFLTGLGVELLPERVKFVGHSISDSALTVTGLLLIKNH